VPPPARRRELAGLRNRTPCPTKQGRCYQEKSYTTSRQLSAKANQLSGTGARVHTTENLEALK